MVVQVYSRRSVELTVPSILVASRDMIRRVVVIAYCEVECIHTRTAICIGVAILVISAHGVRHTVPFVGVAGVLVVAVICPVVDGQIEQHDTVAPHGVCLGISHIVGAGGVGDIVPGVFVAGGDHLHPHAGVVYGEVQRHHAVASGGVGLGIRGGGGTLEVGVAMPGVFVALGNRLDSRIAVVDGEV